MSIEEVAKKLINSDGNGSIDDLCQAIEFAKAVRFHVLDEGQFREESEFFITGKNNPINVPVTEVDSKTYAVMYPTKQLLEQNPVEGYRSFRIRGRESFALIAGLKDVSGIIVQSQYGWVAIPIQKIIEYRDKNA